ncbi:MAG: SDR family oxidoreductase [Terriglobia bacterium]
MRGNIENLKDRTILVTGASRGIGLAIARACAEEGAKTLLTARDRAALRRAAAETPGSEAFAADLTKQGDVARLFARLRRRFRHLDALINSAGVFTFKPFVRTTLADWEKNLGANLTALFLATRAALPLLERGPSPHIVNILSIASRTAFPKCSAYAASKFGALGFTRVLAAELTGIRVTAILPGTTDTRMANEFDFPIDRSTLLQPDDIAQAVLGALLQPARATVNEIVLMPSQGTVGERRQAARKR